jgi:hypothetical protein
VDQVPRKCGQYSCSGTDAEMNSSASSNERLKNFRCLDEKFRHLVAKHSSCFCAICVLTQLAIESGEEIFDAVR